MKTAELEQRVSVLEREFQALKGLVVAGSPPKDWRSTFGAFADDPEFDEILRLGREIRQREAPVE